MSEELSTLKNKTVKGFFWRFGERISSQVVAFAVSVILARLLEPSEYGVIALTMIFMAIANVLADSGLGASLVQKKDADNLDFSTIFYSGLLLSIILYIILYVASPYITRLFHNEQVCPILRVLGLTLPINNFNSVQQAFVSRQLEFKKFFYATFVGTFFSGIIGIVMAYAGYGVWALVGQQVSNKIINTFTLNRIISWHPQLLFSFDRLRALLSFGVRLMGANLIGTSFNELKNFIVGVRYLPADLAFFHRGESLPKLLADNINNTINTVMFPAIAKVQDNEEMVKLAIRRSMIMSSFILVPLMFIMAASADKITLILLTEKWLPCVPFMQVLCINHCVNILGMANLQAFNAVGRSDITLKLEFIKKPLFLAILVYAMTISPLAIAVGNLIYSIIATIVNAWPNKNLISYRLTEQINDVRTPLIISSFVFVVVYAIGFLEINVYFSLTLQFTTGLVIYIFLSHMFAKENMKYIVNVLKTVKS